MLYHLDFNCLFNLETSFYFSLKFAREEVNLIKVRSLLTPYFLIHAVTMILNFNQIGGVVRIYISQFILFNESPPPPHTTRIIYLVYDFCQWSQLHIVATILDEGIIPEHIQRSEVDHQHGWTSGREVMSCSEKSMTLTTSPVRPLIVS